MAGPFPIIRTQLNPRRLDLEGVSARYMTHAELEVVVALVESTNPKAVVEFGINSGRTASVILKEIKSVERYTGIDVKPGYVPSLAVQNPEVPEAAGELVKDDPRLVLLVTTRGSIDLTPEDIGPVDAAFIDGDHSLRGVLNDTELSVMNIRPGGVVIWHDFHDLGNVDVRGVLEFLSKAGWQIQFVVGTWTAFMRLHPGVPVTDEMRSKWIADINEASHKVKSVCN